MFEQPSAKDLLEDAREAIFALAVTLTAEELAKFVAENWNNPGATRRDARLKQRR